MRYLSFDLETTGLKIESDRIVEMAVREFGHDPENGPDFPIRFKQRFNPGIPIHPDATAVHGITDADVKGCPPFSKFAQDIAAGAVRVSVYSGNNRTEN